MKKSMMFLAVFTLLLGAAMAQTEQGAVMVGGNLALRTGEANSQFLLSPNVGFFAANNLALGANLSISSLKRGIRTDNEIGIGPFARYYFGSTSTKPFIVSEFDVLNLRTRGTTPEPAPLNGFGFLFGMGFAAFFNETVAFEGISGYNYSKYRGADGSSGFALRFGFQVYLNNRSMSNLRTNVLGAP